MSIEAMRKALNYIENTEGELGIKLSCGDALRDALAAQPPAAPVEAKHIQCERCGDVAIASGRLCDDCAELSIPHPRSSAGNAGAPGKSDMLELSKRIENGLKDDNGDFFAPPLSRKQWWMIASSLDYAARFDLPDAAQTVGMREALEDIWGLTSNFSQYTLEHFARKVRSKVDAALAAQPPAAPVETDIEALTKDCELYAKVIEGITVVDDETCANERREPKTTLLKAAAALRALPRSSAGSEPVAWMCEKAIWEIVETQRIGGRWLRYLTFDRPAEAEYTRNITPLYSVSPQAVSVRDEMIEHQARFLLDRLQEFDPGDFQAERDFHGHIAPAISRLKSALAMTRPKEK